MLLLLATLASHAQDADPAPEDTGAPVEEELPPIVKMPAIVDFVQAPYPQEAKDIGVEGVVLLLIEIDETGAVSYAEILDEPGFGLGPAALEAIQQCTFSPAEDPNGPTAVALEFEYGFVLDAGTVDDAVPEEPEAPVELPITVEGQVIEMATRQLLPEMSVALQGTDFVTVSDAEGRFALRGVPPGTYQLEIARPGWDTKVVEIEVLDGQVTAAEIWVKNQSYGNDEAVGVYRTNKDEVTTRTISMSEAKKIPGTFGDPVRVIQNLPGAARAPFSTGLLIIRGANPEDSGVYVDGIRIPYVYHLGGFVSVLNSDVVQSVDYLPGSYGVQYGRSMGGAVDIVTKKEAPEQSRLVWNTDLLDSGGLYEGRLGASGNHHVAVAARRSYVDAVIAPFQQNRLFVAAPRWYDYQLRYSYTGFADTTLSMFIFGFDDKLILSTPDDVAQGSDQDFQGDLSLHQFTHRAIFTLEKPLAGAWSMRVSPSFGWDSSYFGVGQGLTLEQNQWLWEIRAEAPWKPNDHVEVVPGVDFIGGWWTFDTQLPFNPDSFAEYDPLAERESWKISDTGTGWGPDTYVKANIRPFKDLDRLYIQPGIRFSYVNIVGQFASYEWDPRIAAKVRVLPRGYLKAATGLYTQPPQSFESYQPEGDYQLGFERAFATSVGYEQQITQGLHAEVEGFYKTLDNLIVTNRDWESVDDNAYTNEGTGEIYGLEVMIRQDPVNRWFGWLSYTWMQSWRQDYEDTDRYLYDFDQTHIFTALGGVQLPYQFEASARFQYVTGVPYTPYDGAFYDADLDFWTPYSTGARNSERLGDYMALDLRVERSWVFKRARLLTYVDLLNVYRGDNPEFRLYNYDYTDYVDVRGLPFLPSPGFELEFYL